MIFLTYSFKRDWVIFVSTNQIFFFRDLTGNIARNYQHGPKKIGSIPKITHNSAMDLEKKMLKIIPQKKINNRSRRQKKISSL